MVRFITFEYSFFMICLHRNLAQALLSQIAVSVQRTLSWPQMCEVDVNSIYHQNLQQLKFSTDKVSKVTTFRMFSLAAN